ncbi:MAG: hypothetical protein ACLQO6_13070 [Desulfomonilaceae bacterium]
MAIIPTPEELAMRIIHFYIHNDKRPGEGYNEGNLMNLQIQGWRNDDLNNGLDCCLEKRWFEKNKNGEWLLTDEGFRVA